MHICVTLNLNLNFIFSSRFYQGLHSVPIESLVQPAPKRLVREMDVKHMKNIMSGLLKEPHLVCNLSPAIGLICKEQCANPDEFTKEKLEEGEYKVETLDGNHSSAALKHLAAEYPNEENFKKRETILYAGPSDEDALYLGYRQNEITKHGKAGSTYTLLCLM